MVVTMFHTTENFITPQLTDNLTSVGTFTAPIAPRRVALCTSYHGPCWGVTKSLNNYYYSIAMWGKSYFKRPSTSSISFKKKF